MLSSYHPSPSPFLLVLYVKFKFFCIPPKFLHNMIYPTSPSMFTVIARTGSLSKLGISAMLMFILCSSLHSPKSFPDYLFPHFYLPFLYIFMAWYLYHIMWATSLMWSLSDYPKDEKNSAHREWRGNSLYQDSVMVCAWGKGEEQLCVLEKL